MPHPESSTRRWLQLRRRLGGALEQHSRGILVAAVAIGLAARLLFGMVYWVDKPLTHDELEYLTLARNFSAGRGFIYDPIDRDSTSVPPQQFGRAPGYPAFLVLAGSFDGVPPAPASVPASIKAVQAVIGSIGVLLVGLIASRIAGAGAGTVSAVIAAVYPPLVWICAYALSEALYSVLALLAVFALGIPACLSDQPRTAIPAGVRFAMAGLVAGIAALTRPVMVLFLVFCTLWLLARRLRWQAVGFALSAAIVIVPWTARSTQETGRFVLIAPGGGVNFWIGNHALARGEGDLAANPRLKDADNQLRLQYRDFNAAELEPIYYRQAIAYITAHPVQWLGLLARKLFYQWVPVGPSYTMHSGRYYWASVLSYLLVLPFAAAGFVEAARHGRLYGPLVLLAGSEILANLIFFPQERYRIPVIDPTLLIFAAIWISPRVLRTSAY